MSNDKYLSVKALNKYIALKLDSDYALKNLTILGEISNARYSKGHLYFILKDDESEISAIMFQTSCSSLTFEPKDGMTVIVTASVNAYPKKGTYNLIAYKIEEYGVGKLYQNFLLLKEKLQKEGLFDDIYKKNIPEICNNIGVITSDTGDAIHDILSTIQKRYPLANVYLYPALVQGNSAPESLIRSLNKANSDNIVDVIIIGRGGGSIEDLSCFNDESLARAIFASRIPVVSGVGHEADVTICDFVSDFRAPTPTGAAVKVTKDKSIIIDEIVNSYNRLNSLIKNVLVNSFNNYQNLIKSYGFANFTDILNQKNIYLDNLISNLIHNSPIKSIEKKNIEVDNLIKRLDIYNINEKIDNFTNNINNINSRMNNYIDRLITNNSITLENQIDKLILVNPLNIMKKGYTITYQDNKLVSSVNQITIDKPLQISFYDGTVEANITKIKKN